MASMPEDKRYRMFFTKKSGFQVEFSQKQGRAYVTFLDREAQEGETARIVISPEDHELLALAQVLRIYREQGEEALRGYLAWVNMGRGGYEDRLLLPHVQELEDGTQVVQTLGVQFKTYEVEVRDQSGAVVKEPREALILFGSRKVYAPGAKAPSEAKTISFPVDPLLLEALELRLRDIANLVREADAVRELERQMEMRRRREQEAAVSANAEVDEGYAPAGAEPEAVASEPGDVVEPEVGPEEPEAAVGGEEMQPQGPRQAQGATQQTTARSTVQAQQATVRRTVSSARRGRVRVSNDHG
ncbi:hypothetical protein [Thermosulfurimonas sp. F29]|uniref:hypothetical protein n=1 Tax=Thermosulfurimonas sp. F29 TaxID=2867247 RepID=UPI001C83A239|nr:hypothetical protein [Thermosulfurimonas sp. F29]MBX6423361.1 hypothetical protein [Thermosulfurimonas sp. F29]